MTARPVLLSGYAAKQCARRVHNEWDSTIESGVWEPPADLQMRYQRGLDFEAEIFRVFNTFGEQRCRDLSNVRGRERAIEATISAMDEGVEIILGGWLPDDVRGARAGRPDILLRRSWSGGAWSYLAGDVKGHRSTKASRRGRLVYSTLASPMELLEKSGRTAETTARFDDYLQLAHYWRMLEACGRAPAALDATGFIIGKDEVGEAEPAVPALVWLDLTAPTFATYSRSRGTVKRSAMERYDHEHGFRRQVAEVAIHRTGASDDPAPLVEPVFKDECDSCPWYEYCRSVVGVDVASAHITSGRLSVREWTALARLGVTSIDELAMLDFSSSSFQDQYLPEVTHVKDPLGRLRDAARRARMIKNDSVLERLTTGPISVPRADIEVDFDIEWDEDNRVYLWGALVSRGDRRTYEPIVTWMALDPSMESDLARSCRDWLRSLIESVEDTGRSILVYHYSHPEPAYLKKLLGESDVADVTDHFVDLLPIIREHYFGVNGLGIKKVAPEFGFRWRDEDPGGLQSQLWLQEARGTGDPPAASAAQTRILEYNEDDVRATAAIRKGLAQTTTAP